MFFPPMTNAILRRIISGILAVSALFNLAMCEIASTSGLSDRTELKLEPSDIIVHVGNSVTFVCSSSTNQSFYWILNNNVLPYKTTEGKGVNNATNGEFYWSQLHLASVNRLMSSEITCVAGKETAVAFLLVNGVHIDGHCTNSDDCVTDGAKCHKGICECSRNEVLMRLSKNRNEVCRKMIYRLYDPCEFSEQCFHLVDRRSTCSADGICVCSPWATDQNGKCVSKGEMTYNKNQQLYMVGLVVITCLIIVIVSVSLWATLRKSCNNERRNGESHLSLHNSQVHHSNDAIVEISDDKPPSYSDAIETIGSPPNFIDALKHCMTAKRLLRQLSAPAGQLISRTTSFSLRPI